MAAGSITSTWCVCYLCYDECTWSKEEKRMCCDNELFFLLLILIKVLFRIGIVRAVDCHGYGKEEKQNKTGEQTLLILLMCAKLKKGLFNKHQKEANCNQLKKRGKEGRSGASQSSNHRQRPCSQKYTPPWSHRRSGR